MKNIDTIVRANKEFPVTEALYSLKKQGVTPMLKVHVVGKDINYARLSVGGIEYYFHNTKDKDGRTLRAFVQESENMGGEKMKIYHIPFDGWEVSSQRSKE